VLNNKSQIIDAIKKIAKVLEDLNEECIYVGGAITGFYADDFVSPEVRPTKDVDIVLEIASQLELEKFRQKLAKHGVHFAPEEKVVCRFRYQNILLDVMSTKEVGWAPANPWFKAGFENRGIQYLDDVKINVMPLAYFLASKFTAFKNRGTDPRTSYDFEDIVFVIDNRTTLVDDILESAEDVRAFLIAELKAILQEPSFQEAVKAHLEPITQTQRYAMLIKKLKEIVK